LLSNTAEIEVDQSISDFNVLPGTHTSAAVAHGINYLFLALAERVAKELDGSRQGYQLLVTGGDGALFASLVDGATYLPDLVLDGLVWSVGP
jgi:type III pantothenate kinase